jgi:hypothetical protein
LEYYGKRHSRAIPTAQPQEQPLQLVQEFPAAKKWIKGRSRWSGRQDPKSTQLAVRQSNKNKARVTASNHTFPCSHATRCAAMAGHHAHLVYPHNAPAPRLSLENFHFIGLDLDYTIARYHNDLAPLVQRCTIRALERFGYAASAFDGCEASIVQKGIVIDIASGDLIKLGSDGRIAAALHGSEWRSAESIAAVHGVGSWRLFRCLQRQEDHDGYWLFVTAFDCPIIPLWARIVELMDRRDPAVAHVMPGDYMAVRKHFYGALDWIFDNKAAWDGEYASSAGVHGLLGGLSTTSRNNCPRTSQAAAAASLTHYERRQSITFYHGQASVSYCKGCELAGTPLSSRRTRSRCVSGCECQVRSQQLRGYSGRVHGLG